MAFAKGKREAFAIELGGFGDCWILNLIDKLQLVVYAWIFQLTAQIQRFPKNRTIAVLNSLILKARMVFNKVDVLEQAWGFGKYVLRLPGISGDSI